MPRIDLNLMSHRMSVLRRARPVAQKRIKMSLNRALTVQEQVESLLKVGFIQEFMYPTCLSNIVMVPKSNGKSGMCVEYNDLNKACPKDSYPLPSLDGLVDVASRFRVLTFMDAYSGYNQIPMHRCNEEKMKFVTPSQAQYYT